MGDVDYKATYVDAVNRLLESHPRDEAMKLAVGGQYQAFGVVMRAMLIDAGLQPEHYVIDVGCGSGRLAVALRSYLKGRYLGLDVVPELLNYAREACARPDWRFEEAQGIAIPEADATADMVCFFSVLTHLLHEDGYRYLLEARRVLKPGGAILFSYLDFAIPAHWPIFNATVETRARGESAHHNQFMGRDVVVVWAARLGMELVRLVDGNMPQVELDTEVILDDGTPLPRQASVGQSLCVLRKPASAEAAARIGAVPDLRGTPEDEQHRLRIAQLEAQLAERNREPAGRSWSRAVRALLGRSR